MADFESYPAPPAPAATGSEADDLARAPYRPLARLTAWVLGLLGGLLILNIILVGLGMVGLVMVDRVQSAPQRLGPGSFALFEGIEAAHGGLFIIAYLACAVVFLVWFNRAYRNLLAFDTSWTMRYAPGWAIGAWFVPFLNLIRPKRIADDIWRASDPSLDSTDPARIEEKAPALILLWWIGWVVSIFLSRAVYLRWSATETVTEYDASYVLTIAAGLVDIAVTVLAMMVVWRLSDRQQRRAVALAGMGVLPRKFRHPSHV